ncbi:MAG: hypothetical protein QGI60_01535 [archaeon]|nr:hypothetical protein [archaeon]
MIRLIDSAAVLNDPGFSFTEKANFLTVPMVADELRDLRSRHLLENALKNGLLKLREPAKEFVEKITSLATKHGFQKLSKTDFSLLALAIELKESGEEFVLVSDDYSVQNFCKLLEIAFESVIRGKIKKTISFSKRCRGCGKEFPSSFTDKDCPECGSKVASTKKTN